MSDFKHLFEFYINLRSRYCGMHNKCKTADKLLASGQLFLTGCAKGQTEILQPQASLIGNSMENKGNMLWDQAERFNRSLRLHKVGMVPELQYSVKITWEA